MLSGPYQNASGEWCADVEVEFVDDFQKAIAQFTGAGVTVRREGSTFFYPTGMKAAEVVGFWNEWVASLPPRDED